jgi:hypothetical protein
LVDQKQALPLICSLQHWMQTTTIFEPMVICLHYKNQNISIMLGTTNCKLKKTGWNNSIHRNITWTYIKNVWNYASLPSTPPQNDVYIQRTTVHFTKQIYTNKYSITALGVRKLNTVLPILCAVRTRVNCTHYNEDVLELWTYILWCERLSTRLLEDYGHNIIAYVTFT